jgi:hypothetical protein
MPPVSDITVGQRYQWFFGDFLRGLNGGPGRMRRSLGALSYARGSAQSVFEPRDPVPAVRHMTIVASRFFF